MAANKVQPNRDSVTTIREDGSRLFLHPADVKGPITRWRRSLGWLLVAVFLLLPVIHIGGHPAVFFDVAERRFHLLGTTLAFQDTWLMFFLITGLGFSLFFVTSLFGRLWCGWTCPQTVFLEHVYRWIERRIEGDASRRRALDAAPWHAEKIFKRTLKQVLFLLISALIAHMLLAYFVSLPVLLQMVWGAPVEHWSAFLFVWVFTLILYFNFAWFREQLCLIICPYGRLQSTMIDDNSMVVGYDVKRGEPRGRVGKEGAGDCINCNRCVQVCPTGIDIRQGLQIECISCAACIDACNEIMFKINRPKGLIRHDSINGLSGQRTRWIRPRTIIYSILLLIGAVIFAVAYNSIKPVVLGVTRMTGASYVIDADAVRNQFFVRLVNKQDVPVTVVVHASAAGDIARQSGFNEPVTLKPLEEILQPLVLSVPFGKYEGRFPLTVTVEGTIASAKPVATAASPAASVPIGAEVAGQAGEGSGTAQVPAAGGRHFVLSREVEFIGPDAQLLKEDLRARGVVFE